jgi:hypothetical protein
MNAGCRAARVTVTALVALTLAALAVGLRPHTLAREFGPPPFAAGDCLLCDGAPTAASVAPPAQNVSLSYLSATVLLDALRPLQGRAVLLPSPARALPPDSPPPRA